MNETGVEAIPWVATPSIDDRIDDDSQQPGKQKATAASHLMFHHVYCTTLPSRSDSYSFISGPSYVKVDC